MKMTSIDRRLSKTEKDCAKLFANLKMTAKILRGILKNQQRSDVRIAALGKAVDKLFDALRNLPRGG